MPPSRGGWRGGAGMLPNGMKPFPLVLSALLLGALPAAAQEAASPRDWHALARSDVLAAYQIFAANHAGMKDPTNPGFAARLAAARDSALKVADSARDRAGYSDSLGAFTAALSDGHAQVFANDVPKPGAAASGGPDWPGFVAAWRGKRAFVHQASAASPAPAGSTILSCDGRPVAELIRSRLLYARFRPAEAGHWWARTPQAFAATADTPRDRPRRCTFKLPDGRKRESALAWGSAPADLGSRLRRASDGERTAIGLTEPKPGVFLVGLPDFDPGAEGVKAYRALYADLESRRAELLRARAVLLDLRYNNGGSSSWSREVAGRLWGEQAVKARMENLFRRVRIWWRASPGNAAYMAEMEAKLRGNGQTDLADSIHSVGEGLKASLAAGRDHFVEDSDKPADPPAAPVPPTDFAAPVYVITPGRCASACLDAIDTFRQFRNVRLIGAPTSADSTYMEVRVQPLPSGEGKVVIPVKLWMHRPRGSGAIYRPDIEVDDLDWSTATFLARIEKELARR